MALLRHTTTRPLLCLPHPPRVPVLITVTSKWARWRLKSPASLLFTQPFIQAQIKENTKVPRHWPLCGEFTGDRWIPRTNGQLCGKYFHLMTSPWMIFVENSDGSYYGSTLNMNIVINWSHDNCFYGNIAWVCDFPISWILWHGQRAAGRVCDYWRGKVKVMVFYVKQQANQSLDKNNQKVRTLLRRNLLHAPKMLR